MITAVGTATPSTTQKDQTKDVLGNEITSNNPHKPPEDRLVPPPPLSSPATMSQSQLQQQNQTNLLNQLPLMPHVSQQMGQIGQPLP